jgi:hypothetical protein
MNRSALGLVSVLAGCSQLLGLDDTKFEQRDAMTDAPSVCDGAPRCTNTTGRSVCGQLFGTGTSAGQIVRAAAATGETCTTLGSSEGPCANQVYAQPLASYYAGTSADRITGELDDCGRFVVPDLDTTVENVAIVFNGPNIVESTTLVLKRPMAAGDDRGIAAPLVGTSLPAEWATQIGGANPPTIDLAYLVTYINPSGVPIATQELRINGGVVADPPTVPWGAYFSGDSAYGSIDPAANATTTSGSAIVVPASGSFMLGGFRPGKNCTPVTVEPKQNAFIHLALSC